MKKRIITGLVIGLVYLGTVALRFVWLPFFDILTLLIMLASGEEMISAYNLADKKSYKYLVYAFSFLTYGSCFLVELLNKPQIYFIVLQMLSLLIIFIFCFIVELLTMQKQIKEKQTEQSSQDLIDNKHLIDKTITTLKICIYPLLPLSCLFGINHFGLYDGMIAILLATGVACFSDTCAYTFGMLFGQKQGRKKLCPTISPNKSVIGFLFGCLGGIVASMLVFVLFNVANICESSISQMSIGSAILLFSVIGIFGTLISQFGDLFSSAFKRKVGIKDFGSCFPGHGGFMDRVDSLMFISMFVYLCFLLVL